MTSTVFASQPLLTVASNQKISKSSFPKRVWHKVCEVFKRIWNTICFWKRSSSKLTSRQIKLLNDYKKNHLAPRSPQLVLNRPITVETTYPLIEQLPPLNESKPVLVITKKFDESLENMREFAQAFTSMIVEDVYAEKMEGIISRVQKGVDMAPEIAKSIAHLAAQIGDKAHKPIFEKLIHYKIKEKVDPSIKQMLQWLVSEKSEHNSNNNSNLREKILPMLDERLQGMQMQTVAPEMIELCAGESIETYKELLLKWLFETDHSVELLDYVTSKGLALNQKTLEIVLDTTVTLLLETKIDHYSNLLHQTLKDDLPKIVRQAIKDNTARFTDILSARAAELIENAPYTETFDKILKAFFNQTKGYLDVEKVQSELAEEAKKAAQEAKKKEEEANQAVKKAYQKNEVANTKKTERTKKKASEATKKMELAKETMEEAKRRAEDTHQKMRAAKVEELFARVDACHPVVKEMISISEGQDRLNHQRAIEMNVYCDTAKKLLDLMFPSKQERMPDGTFKEIDGIAALWGQLIIPEAFTNLSVYAEELIQEILTPKSYKLLQSVREPIFSIVEKFIITLAQDEIKKAMITGMQKMVERMITPNSLNQMMVQDALPVVEVQLLQIFAKQTIEKNINTTAAWFYDLVQVSEQDEPILLEQNSDQLYKLVLKDFKEFSAADAGITLERFREIIIPALLDIRDFILEAKSKIEPGQKFDHNFVKEIIKVYSTNTSKENNSIYGKLVTNIIEIGDMRGLAGELTKLGFVKERISKAITSSTQKIRADHKHLINTAINAARKTHLKKDTIHHLLFDPNRETKAQLEEMLDKTRKLLDKYRKIDADPNEIKKLEIKLKQIEEKLVAEVEKEKQNQVAFKSQVHRIAVLTRDLISQSMSKLLGATFGTLADKLCSTTNAIPSSDALESIISNCYQKLLGNKLLNESLAFRIRDIVIVESLGYSSQKIAALQANSYQKIA